MSQNYIGDDTFVTCPNCDHDSMVVSENDTRTCPVCHYSEDN